MKTLTERLMSKGLSRYESVIIACAIEHAVTSDDFAKAYGRLMAEDLQWYLDGKGFTSGDSSPISRSL